ncbi:DUF6895 family protein [Kitasatospora sp. NPDC127111]|uniref:DUF6895 family protein n=1 Tax=Kitasatospora sp. NPDC127111 TaxID=3345363 RepID=UPI00364469D6
MTTPPDTTPPDTVLPDTARSDATPPDTAASDATPLDITPLAATPPGTAPPGTVPPGTAPSDLHRLSAGTLAWLERNLDRFDPYAPGRGHSEHEAPYARAKAALELALLRHCWARLGAGDDPRLGRVTALVRTLWPHPDFPRLVTADPRCAAYYGLVYAALAPDGIDDRPCRAVLARLAADDLSPRGRSPYQRLELRYYADKAGVRHTVEPYEELIARNVLVTLPAEAARRAVPAGEAPVTVPEAYAVTHSAFYLSDFGRTGPGLPADARADAAELVSRLLEHCARRDWWDLAAELLITQVCLGLEPLRTPCGTAALACLARAQQGDGAIPGRSAGTRASAADPAGAFFAKAYHTTLVTALMTLLVTSAGAA